MKFFNRTAAVCVLFSLTIVAATLSAEPRADLVIDAKSHSVGENKSVGPRLDAVFSSRVNSGEVTLRITHSGVIQPWNVLLNGKPVAALPPSYKGASDSYFRVPPGALADGANTLSIVGENSSRKITAGNFLLYYKPLADLLKLRTVSVSVTDGQTGKPVPARIGIFDAKGRGADIFSVSATNAAVRTGLIYTSGDATTFQIPEGRYEFSATRGMEWGLGKKTVALVAGPRTEIKLRIRRQVDTRGFIAADTHIHTVTFSGHGDATTEERMMSLAGEGVELAIATDHNHFTDYRPSQSRLELNSFFTPVIGDEITTKNGHLNAFPFSSAAAVPDHNESDWVKLVADARVKGAKVVILNHPHYPDPENNPLARFNFNRASGDRFNGPAFTFNAMELVNSSSPSSIGRAEIIADPMRIFADWFPILNRGEKITGVGSSDSHTVGNPVGQGRTYIRSSTDDAAHLNVDELVTSFLAGDTSVSYGIFAEAGVNGRRHMGETVRTANGKAEVTLRVVAADWIKPRRAIVFLNGLSVAEKKLEPKSNEPFDQRLVFSIKTPPHDAYLVGAVFGDGVTEPCWPTIANFTAAVSNPIYLDNDGDGKFQFPRETARQMLAATDGSQKSVWSLLEKSDDVLAGQMLGLLYMERDAAFVKQLDARVRAASSGRELYRTFQKNSPLVVVKAQSLKAPAGGAKE